jgi:carbon storage regulator
MLVLSREKGESIFIGEHGEIKICIVDIRGDKVRLGITADTSIPINREEIFVDKIISDDQ